ncbi:(2Fe-2S)-binding protein [Streptomyces albireticuli]|uniref:Ferric iron reductase n=1 Tax=Streptomyces albireticuli TaxID=1940 RepID=A0A2A2D190_9ACTN|nr:(2Fe-2S)-binding protein [Streptomyces albireticuli]MCD9141155.1 (2Fe-2S)-binding protein [Streptomyces albireticuli]MCD9160884.1 (2Fe-2S)-binding protein [Streptomyces albireticuli]MCD9191059.1 (2Fe-2S)-binding protein [Streptomyces albireticuli]PAU46203.1 ferric iron reductase [Streptomyces albireticuli]
MRLRELASVGPFFALRTEDDGPADDGSGYLPLGEEAVRARVATVAERLGTEDRRVAASVAFQGIAGRLLSVALGSAALTGQVPDLSSGRLGWHPARTAPDDLWLPRPEALPPSDDPAELIRTRVLHGPLALLHTATRAAVPVSGRLLWGNAASSLAGSLRVLHTWCRAEGRPREAARALALAEEILADPVLRGTGTLSARGRGGPSFVRTTCCLYYRVLPGGMCGDCVLRHAPRAR